MEKSARATTVTIESLGCKLNQAEAEGWARELRMAGYRVVDAGAGADVYILNTCTLTHVADRKSRHLLRMARRRNPDALIVAAGCYSERAAEYVAGLEGVGLVVGNREKALLAEIIADLTPNPFPSAASGQAPRGKGEYAKNVGCELPSLKGRGTEGEVYSRTRAMVKIQDGCNEFCTYCIVPFVRGRQRSRSSAEVLSDIRQRVSEGRKEVVLTGTQIGAYGRDGGNEDLADLVRLILRETDLTRLRLTSIHPQDLSERLLALWQDERLCRHLHLSLQSGRDSVLKRMGRRYDTALYSEAVHTARRAAPEMAITTDVIVGFPGESGNEFEGSFAFCREMAFARMHVFSYSARRGTKAAALPEQVPEPVKKERSRRMLALAAELEEAYRHRFLGTSHDVLWESAEADGVWSGLTGNYLKVYARGGRQNCLSRMALRGAYKDGLWAEAAC